MNWPVDDRAPWVDANNDDIYNPPDGDHPDIIGDMFHWYVMNDAGAAPHASLFGTAPMNLEVQDRKNRKIIRLLRNAKLKYKTAYLTDIDYHSARGLKKSIITSLSQKQWIDNYQNLIITGPTGTGKTWLANALTNHFITSGYPALYLRIAQLINEVALVRVEGTYIKWLKKISRFQLLVLDDLGLTALTTQQAQELLEVIEERSGTGSIIVTSQLPVKEWYSYFKNPTLADAIMDRLIHNSYRINLKGESMRKTKNSVNHSYTSE